MRRFFQAGDLWGGLAAMLVTLPQSIAFGIIVFSALDPNLVSQGAIAGTIGAIALGIVAPLAGGTARLISAPCAPAAAFLGGLAAENWLRSIGAAGPQAVIAVLFLVILFSGFFQLAFSILGGGKVIKYIPYPVVAGYMSSVGIIIFLGQLPRVAGLPANEPLLEIISNPSAWHLHALLIASVTILVMYLSPRFTQVLPAPIFGLLAGAGVFGILALFYPEYRLLDGNKLAIGRLQGEFSSSAFLGRFAGYGSLGFDAVKNSAIAGATLAVILSIDTLKTCVVVDTITRSRGDSNRELLGQGLGNLAAAAFGGIGGAGTLGATLVNISSGGLTKLSGAFAGILALITLLVFSPLLAWVPVPALAGILILVGARMIDWRLILLVTRRITVLDFLVIITVIAVALRFSLMSAAGAGVALSALFFLREQMRGSVVHKRSFAKEISSKRSRLPDEQKILQKNGKCAVVYELQGSLFFGNTDRLFTQIADDLEEARFVILSMRRVQSLDSTAIHMFERIHGMLDDKGGRLMLADLPDSLSPGATPTQYLKEAGLLKAGSNILIFDEFYYALEWVEDFILSENNMYHSQLEEPMPLAEIDMFRGLTADRVSLIEKCVQPRSYAQGECIFHADSPGDEIFFIRRGIVKIMLRIDEHRMHHLASFGRGDFFGDMSFVDKEMRSADAVAETDCDVFILSRSKFAAVLDRDPELGREFYESLVRVLAHRFRAVHMELRALE